MNCGGFAVMKQRHLRGEERRLHLSVSIDI
jgi:hypothetical protein